MPCVWCFDHDFNSLELQRTNLHLCISGSVSGASGVLASHSILITCYYLSSLLFYPSMAWSDQLSTAHVLHPFPRSLYAKVNECIEAGLSCLFLHILLFRFSAFPPSSHAFCCCLFLFMTLV